MTQEFSFAVTGSGVCQATNLVPMQVAGIARRIGRQHYTLPPATFDDERGCFYPMPSARVPPAPNCAWRDVWVRAAPVRVESGSLQAITGLFRVQGCLGEGTGKSLCPIRQLGADSVGNNGGWTPYQASGSRMDDKLSNSEWVSSLMAKLYLSMKTVSFKTIIGRDGKLRINVPCDLPPGPAEGVVVVHPVAKAEGPPYDTLAGLLKGVFPDDIDIDAELEQMNQEWKNSLQFPQ